MYEAADIGSLSDLSRPIADEAVLRGLKVEVISPRLGIFVLSNEVEEIWCRESLSSKETAMSAELCGDKRLSKELVAGLGLSVPRTPKSLMDYDVKLFIEEVGSVVLKPVIGEQGENVCVDIESFEALSDALRVSSLPIDAMMVEEFVGGFDVRVLVIGGKSVAAAKRTPPFVIGTGVDDIATLVQRKTRDRMRYGPKASEIVVDDEAIRVLGLQSMNMQSIPRKGERIDIRRNCNVHTGGEIVDVTDQLSRSILESCEKISSELRTAVLGIDLILKDFESDRFVFIEANERPALVNHEPVDVVGYFLDYLFPGQKK